MILNEHFSDVTIREAKLDALIDRGVLTLLVSGSPKKRYAIEFKRALGYRVSDEGDRQKFVGELLEETSRRHWCYQVTDSEYLQWFIEESLGRWPFKNVKHYVVVTCNDIIDVIAAEEPTVLEDTSKIEGDIKYPRVQSDN